MKKHLYPINIKCITGALLLILLNTAAFSEEEDTYLYSTVPEGFVPPVKEKWDAKGRRIDFRGPQGARTYDSGEKYRSSEKRGDFGSINLKKLHKDAEKVIGPLLSKYKNELYLFNGFEFRIREWAWNKQWVAFEQVVDGIAIDETIGSLNFDLEDGFIQDFSATNFDRKTLNLPQVIVSQENAEFAAQQVIETKLAILLENVEFNTLLRYSVDKNEAYWQIRVAVSDTHYDVKVNAVTNVAEHIEYEDIYFWPDICKKTVKDSGTSTSLNCQGTTDAEKIYDGDTCVATTTLCDGATFKEPHETLNEYYDWASNGTIYCCVPFVDIMLDRSGDTQAPTYDQNNRVIKFPNPIETSDPPILSTASQTMRSEEILVHEYAHHVLVHGNANVDLNESDKYFKGMAEGLADVAAALYMESKCGGDATCISNAWIQGENILSTPRDLKTDKQLNDYSTSASDHENGKVIGNMFYRLRQAGISITDLNKILMRVLNQVKPGSNGWDPDDIKQQIDWAVEGNSAHEDIVEEIWIEIDNRPVTTIPASIPTLSGTFMYCNGSYAHAYLTWNGVHTTSYYGFTYTTQSGWAPLAALAAPATWVFVGSTQSTSYRLQACNDNGCSAPSNSYYQVNNCE